MQIAGLSIGIEAFHDTIHCADAHALASLSILSKEWNRAVASRLHDQRLAFIHGCFPFIGLDGKCKIEYINTEIDIYTMPININSFVATTKICQQIQKRKKGCRHPSYRALFELDAFYIPIDADQDTHIRMFHFMMSCAKAMADDARGTLNANIMKVCWTYIVLKFYHQHLVNGLYPEFYEQSFLMESVMKKMAAVRLFMTRNLNYVPDVLAYQISKLSNDLTVRMK